MSDHTINLFVGTLETLSRSLNLRSRNHEMILNNVANADTPRYKPFALNVEEALKKNSPHVPETTVVQTNDKHLAARRNTPNELMKNSRSTGDDPLLFRGDYNGVDIDQEMTALAKNSLLYKASAQLVAAKFKGLKHALTGGSK